MNTEDLINQTKNSGNVFIEFLHLYYNTYGKLSIKQISCLKEHINQQLRAERRREEYVPRRRIKNNILQSRFQETFFKHHGGIDYGDMDYD